MVHKMRNLYPSFTLVTLYCVCVVSQVTTLLPGSTFKEAVKQQEMVYFKVDEINSSIPFIQTVITPCQGMVSVFVKSCPATQQCNNETVWLPTTTNYTFTYSPGENSVGEGSITSICNSFDGLCENNFVYYIGIFGVTIAATIEITLQTLNTNNGTTVFTNDPSLSITNVGVSWTAATYCTNYTAEGCIMSELVPNALYTVYYEPVETTNNNMGTECGMTLAIPSGDPTTLYTADLDFQPSTLYVVNVLMRTTNPQQMTMAYTAQLHQNPPVTQTTISPEVIALIVAIGIILIGLFVCFIYTRFFRKSTNLYQELK